MPGDGSTEPMEGGYHVMVDDLAEPGTADERERIPRNRDPGTARGVLTTPVGKEPSSGRRVPRATTGSQYPDRVADL
ncbi:hypothetical protein BJF83_04550 [Nocardiopsis sp. CNR-923]|nr:hypothetical protein BJF83_04550 [Nocardiopsis sp. CNR-923]